MRSIEPGISRFRVRLSEAPRNDCVGAISSGVGRDGVGFSSIGRLELLTMLQARAREAGVAARYEAQITSLDQFAGYDLIVAADGLNSLVRRAYEGDFGSSLSYSTNKFAWYGT